MTLRKVRTRHNAIRDDIADLVTHRALPTEAIDQIDPFLFLNHHGPQIYPPRNRGLPFGPHPHRGFETVTFILEGDIAHHDTGGHESVIQAGGVQWMTAGSGLVHSEVSSEEFKAQGGPLEILQLWVNLPARLKMTKPMYLGLQKAQIPQLECASKKGKLELISGQWQDQQGPIQSLTDVNVMIIKLETGAEMTLRISPEQNIFFYLVRGSLEVNGELAQKFQLVDFEEPSPEAGEVLKISTKEKSLILLCHAAPLRETVVAHGPFVMNTRDEILEAISDYQAGKMG